MGSTPIPKSHCALNPLEPGLHHLYANTWVWGWRGIYIQSITEVSVSAENGEFFEGFLE